MKNYEINRLESAIHEMQTRAKSARAATGMEAEKHGETSLQAQRYAWEACAFEDCVRFVERALDDLAKHNTLTNNNTMKNNNDITPGQDKFLPVNLDEQLANKPDPLLRLHIDDVSKPSPNRRSSDGITASLVVALLILSTTAVVIYFTR